MGPKRTDNTNKITKPPSSLAGASSTIAGGTTGEQESQQCVGKFAADLELCCRELALAAYPVNIPVHIRGHPPQPAPPPPPQPALSLSQHTQQQQQQHSGTSQTPSTSVAAGEEQLSSHAGPGKKGNRTTRITSASQSGLIAGPTAVDHDGISMSISGQEQSKTSSSSYKTFHLLTDSDFFRPKLLADSTGTENEPVDQITALYMRAWQLDQRFIDILRKVLPLQEQLHTLNFCFVGLTEQTIYGLADLCQVAKNLKSVSLDGNPLAADHFHILIDKDESKIVHLSLRFCKISDTGAGRLAHALGNMLTQNWKLLTLTLTGNRIGDNGGKSFAQALRYNRTLISLNLSSNFITDKGACALAMVLRRILLTSEEILQRRSLLSERYADMHMDELRNNAVSPTPSTVSTKSKSGRDSRGDWKRVTDPNKRKVAPLRIAQIVADKRVRADSTDENRPPSANKGDQKRGRNDGGTSRSSTINLTPSGGTSTRRTPGGGSTTAGKESDSTRTSGKKKVSTSVTNVAKKNISIVKEEDEDAGEEGRPSDLSLSGKTAFQVQQVDRENPLLETNEIESHNGELWLKGNLVLLSLNLSRNYLTLTSVNEFLLSVQYQSALNAFSDTGNVSSANQTVSSVSMDYSGLCRLELKGMNDISTKSSVFQSLEMLLIRRSPSTRFQQFKEREAREYIEQQQQQQQQQHPQQTVPSSLTSVSEKVPNAPEKTRVGSTAKSTSQRPTSRLKD